MTGYQELADRIEKLESIEKIKKLKARYFRLVDERKHTEFAALFTPDAVIVTDGITWEMAHCESRSHSFPDGSSRELGGRRRGLAPRLTWR